VLTPGARGLLDWTQAELAQKAGVALRTIQDFENSRRTPLGVYSGAMGAGAEAAGFARPALDRKK
jgi:hypothetical protein